MLRQLGTTSGYNLGIATGGWSHTARAKLAAAQLETNALPLASSDDHFARIEIMKYCARHLGGENQTPVYVGDGEWDLIACQELGWGFIGIGERLKDKCPVWIPDYSEANFPNLIETARAACHGE